MENEHRKFTIVSLFVLSSLVGLVFHLLITQILFALKWSSPNVLLGLSSKNLVLASAILIGLVLFLATSLNKAVLLFSDEVFSELVKTTWPTPREASLSTMVVSILIGIAALILFLVDAMWGVLFRTIL